MKAKSSEIVPTPLCIGNITKQFSQNSTKKTRLKGYFYDFSVDFDTIAVADILDIEKYLMKKNEILQ